MSSSRSSRWLLPLLLAARLAVGVTYSLITPIWEADNEDSHFAYAHYIARHHTLLQPGNPEAERIWEKFQPPLYYLLVAIPLAGFNFTETFPWPVRHPLIQNGNVGYNYALHPDRLQGLDAKIALAVLVLRAFGVALSTASVLFVYRGVRLIWPRDAKAAWAATSLYAFWPQFLFTGSMVTNDVLVTVLAAILFYLTLLLVTRGFRVRWVLGLGLTLGSAMLTKITAAGLIPMAALALGLSLWSGAPRAQIWSARRSLLVLAGVGVVIALALWGLSSMKFVTAQIFQPQTIIAFLRAAPDLSPITGRGDATIVDAALGYGFRTFLASYGWGNVETYPWVYNAWAVGAVLALVGLIVAGVRCRPPLPIRLLLVLGIQVAVPVTLALSLAIAYRTMHITGRYHLLALPGVSALLVSGWGALLPRGLRRYAWKLVSAGIVLLSWSIPLWTIAPAYAKPRPQIAPAEVPTAFHFGDAIELAGYNRPAPARPGLEAQITLCWQALAPVTENYTVFLEIVGPDGQGYGRLATYPGHGNYATSLWAVRVPFCDRYVIPVGSTFPAPALAQVHVALLLTTDVNGERLPVLDAASNPIESRAISIPLKVVASSPAPELAQRVEYHFGDELILHGYAVTPAPEEHAVRVALRWEALRDLTTDYVVFVHLRDTPAHAYAQGDSPPLNGWYPTSLWQKGEAVLDEHTLTLPPGGAPPLTLYVGVLRAGTGVRLPASDAAGHPIPNDEVILERDVIFASVP